MSQLRHFFLLLTCPASDMHSIRLFACLIVSALSFKAYAQDGWIADLKLTTKLSAPHVWGNQAPQPVSGEPIELTAASDLAESGLVQRVIAAAYAMVGLRYRLGGDSEAAVDCSAFVRRAYSVAGIDLPRGTSELIKLGDRIDADELEPGDLIFYRWQRRGLHVAVYAGDGEILHASPSARQVIRTPITADWTRRFVSARRLI